MLEEREGGQGGNCLEYNIKREARREYFRLMASHSKEVGTGKLQIWGGSEKNDIGSG